MRSLVIIVATLGALGSSVRADQCQLVEQDVADWAVKLLAKGVTFVAQCEPCGDKGPSQPQQVTKISQRAGTHDASLRQVVVNGKEIDLAYVFVQTGKLTFTNAALMLGCPTQSVSSTVAVRAAKKWPAKLPQACREYDRMIQRVLTCEKLPKEARDAMKQGFDAMSQAWEQLDGQPNEAVKAIGDACKAGADAMQQAMGATGC
jgi:hypothetical protein